MFARCLASPRSHEILDKWWTTAIRLYFWSSSEHGLQPQFMGNNSVLKALGVGIWLKWGKLPLILRSLLCYHGSSVCVVRKIYCLCLLQYCTLSRTKVSSVLLISLAFFLCLISPSLSALNVSNHTHAHFLPQTEEVDTKAVSLWTQCRISSIPVYRTASFPQSSCQECLGRDKWLRGRD